MDDLHEAVFRWPSTDVSDVIVTGTFDQWSSSIHLARTERGFEAVVKVPWGQRIPYKFIVDGRWTTQEGFPMEADKAGNINNVYISPPKPPHFPIAPPLERAAPTAAPNGVVANGVTEGVASAPSETNKDTPSVASTPKTSVAGEAETVNVVSSLKKEAEPVQTPPEPTVLAPDVPVEVVPVNAPDTSTVPPPVTSIEPSPSVESPDTVVSPAAQDSIEPSTHSPVGVSADAPVDVVPAAPSGLAEPVATQISPSGATKASNEPNGTANGQATADIPDKEPIELAQTSTTDDVSKPNGTTTVETSATEKATPEIPTPTKAAPTATTEGKPAEQPVVPPAPTTPPPSAPVTPSKKSHHRFPSMPGSSRSSVAGDSPTSSKFSTSPRKKKDSVFKRLSSIFHRDKDKEKNKENGH